MNKSEQFPKLSLGLALLLLGLLLFNYAYKINSSGLLSKSFENEPVKIEGFNGHNTDEELPIRIEIPGVGINLPVRKAEIVNGYWEVFEDSAGWGDESGVPGKVGNQVIFAHAREGLFLPLQEVEPGTDIFVYTESIKHEYSVVNIKEVKPNELEVVAPTADETLTLYTCSGYKDEKRLIIIAKKLAGLNGH